MKRQENARILELVQRFRFLDSEMVVAEAGPPPALADTKLEFRSGSQLLFTMKCGLSVLSGMHIIVSTTFQC